MALFTDSKHSKINKIFDKMVSPADKHDIDIPTLNVMKAVNKEKLDELRRKIEKLEESKIRGGSGDQSVDPHRGFRHGHGAEVFV